MKQNYKAPQSEQTQISLSSLLLQESLVVIEGYYGGEDAIGIDGEW